MEREQSNFDFEFFSDDDIEQMDSMMNDVIDSLNIYIATELNFSNVISVDFEDNEIIEKELINSINEYNPLIEIDYSLII